MFNVLAINPIAFSLGPLEVRWYGILIALGIVLAFIVVQKEMVKRGMHPDFLTDLLIWAVPIAIISARIYYVIFSWDYYKDHPGQIIQIWEGGIAIHGALIGAFITTYFFTKKRGISFWKVVDIAAAGLLIGQIIGRWGNFMNQEAHGGPVSEKFLETTIIPDWIMNQMTIEGVTYHPTFLYESMWNIVGLNHNYLVAQSELEAWRNVSILPCLVFMLDASSSRGCERTVYMSSVNFGRRS